MNTIYIGDWQLDPPDEPDTDEIPSNNDDFDPPDGYNEDSYLDPNAP